MENIELIKNATLAKENAYAPYSKFKVGACVLTESGKIYCGANVENISSPIGICAEKLALSCAIFNKEKILKIAICGDNEYTYPCGSCRQIMMEFNPDMEVIIGNLNNFKVYKAKDLLPESFSF